MLHTEKSDHPMFDGFDSDEITILTEKSPYATFTDYEGSVLGGISVSDTEKGATIGFEPRSNQHVHLILSSFEVIKMVGQERGWTNEGKKDFVKAEEWAKEVNLEGEGQELT